jgi:hypothetical protein
MAASGDRTRIPELKGIEFTGHASIRKYSIKLREIEREFSQELDWGAEELYAVLCQQRGHPMLAGLDVRLRARRVCRRLTRIAELHAGAAVEAVRFYAQFRSEFADVINPDKSKAKRSFDFNDEE